MTKKHYKSLGILPRRAIDATQNTLPQRARSLSFSFDTAPDETFWLEMFYTAEKEWSVIAITQKGYDGENLSIASFGENLSLETALKVAQEKEKFAFISGKALEHRSITDFHFSTAETHLNFLANQYGFCTPDKHPLQPISNFFGHLAYTQAQSILKDNILFDSICSYTGHTPKELIHNILQYSSFSSVKELSFSVLAQHGYLKEALHLFQTQGLSFSSSGLNPVQHLPYFLVNKETAEAFLSFTQPLPKLLSNVEYSRQELVGGGKKTQDCLVTRLAGQGQDDKLQILLELGASVMGSNFSKNAPLVKAVENQRETTISLLLKHGAADYRLKKHNKLYYWNDFLENLYDNKRFSVLNKIIRANSSLLGLRIGAHQNLAELLHDKKTPETAAIIDNAVKQKQYLSAVKERSQEQKPKPKIRPRFQPLRP